MSRNDPLHSMQATPLDSTRRALLQRFGLGVGAMALGSLLTKESSAASVESRAMAPREPHFAPRAKSIIFLFMAGGPSQLDLFTDKPKLREHHGQLPPQSYLEGKRFAFLKGNETAWLFTYIWSLWPMRSRDQRPAAAPSKDRR